MADSVTLYAGSSTAVATSRQINLQVQQVISQYLGDLTLGLPSSGVFSPGLVAFDPAKTVADALDSLNAGALYAGQGRLGDPTSGTYAGYVSGITNVSKIADAVQGLNAGLQAVAGGTLSSLNVTGNALIGGTLSVSGATTLAALTAGAASAATLGLSGTLNVSGLTTLAALSATSLNVVGLSSLGAVTATTCDLTGAATFGSTLQLSDAGAAATPTLRIGAGLAGLYQPASGQLGLSAGGLATIVINPTDASGTSILLTGNPYVDGASPILRFGTSGASLIGYPSGLYVRTADGSTGGTLIAGSIFINSALVCGNAGVTIPSSNAAGGSRYGIAGRDNNDGWWFDGANGATYFNSSFDLNLTGRSGTAGVSRLTIGTNLITATKAISCPSITASAASSFTGLSTTTLSTSGIATLASASITGVATVGGTLGVTGLTTLAALSATTGSFSGSVSSAGDLVSGSAGAHAFGSRSKITSDADGFVTLLNNAGTGFSGLRFGGATSGFAMWRSSASTLAARLADDSGDSPISASSLLLSAGLSIASGTAAIPSFAFSANTAYGLSYDTTNLGLRVSNNGLTGALFNTAGAGSSQQHYLRLGGSNAVGGVAIKCNGLAGNASILAVRTWDDGAYAAVAGLAFSAFVGNVTIFNPTANTHQFAFTQSSSGSPFTGLRYIGPGQMRCIGNETVGGNPPGSLLQNRLVSTKTANFTVAIAEASTVFSNNGAAGAITATLPTAQAGLHFQFHVRAAQTFNVVAASGSSINVAGAVTGASRQASAATVGFILMLTCTDGTNWDGVQSGTWTLT